MLVIIGQYAEGTEQIDDRHKRYQLLGNLRYTLDSPITINPSKTDKTAPVIYC